MVLLMRILQSTPRGIMALVTAAFLLSAFPPHAGGLYAWTLGGLARIPGAAAPSGTESPARIRSANAAKPGVSARVVWAGAAWEGAVWASVMARILT